MSLVWLPAEAVARLAGTLTITDHRTGATAPWQVNPEQRRLLEETATGGWVFAAKPRQVGATTMTQLDDMLWCAVNDAAGNRVRCGLYVDTDKKLKERSAFAESVCTQLPEVFKGCSVNSEQITFPRGSVLVFGTGSGKSEGRSGSFQRLHLSELPFWANDTTYGSLMPSLSLEGGQCIIETTLDVDAPCGVLARSLWRQPNRYQRLFFSVEDHHEYVADPGLLSDEQWAWCREQGFTRRESAAWWLCVALPDICAGDVNRLMREYPQTTTHMFAASASRWIPVDPKVVDPVCYYECGGVRVPVWRRLADTSGQVIVSVDTGKGVERDRSSVVVLDKRDQHICACFVANTLDVHSFAAVVRDLLHHFSAKQSKDLLAWGIRHHDPAPADLVVEGNGIGEAMVLELRRLGCAVIETTTDDASKVDGLTLVRAACIDGRLFGPSWLAEEADDLCKDERGNWKGRKDLLMSIGFALIRCRMNPWVRAPEPRRQGQVDVAAMLRGKPTSMW